MYPEYEKVNAFLAQAKSLLDTSRTMEDIFVSSMKRNEKEDAVEYINDKGKVNLMTIHASKGLEFNVCYFASLYHKFNISEAISKFSYDDKYGIIIPYKDKFLYNTIYHTLSYRDYVKENIGERIRLFYVALTRAKEKMIFVLPNKNKEDIYDFNDVIDISVRSKYSSFASIMYSLEKITKPYYKSIDLNNINLTKNYNLIKNDNYMNSLCKCNEKLDVKEIDVKLDEKKDKSFSKKSNSIITSQDRSKLDYGLKLHELLELTDFKNVNYTSILVIFVLMLLVLKSISLPFLLVTAIEFAIFINMGVPYLTGTKIPFIASVVIGTIQLGATIDYAILMTTKYLEERKNGKDKEYSVKSALDNSVTSIFVSGLCFFGATIGVGLVSKIDMIGSLCTLIARGAIISMAADIAYRMVRLNPQLGLKAAQETPGVVLIDEIDMHLHPLWQQTVLQDLMEAFPGLQFIVTTHSPQVLSTVPAESIRVLVWSTKFEGIRYVDFSYGADSAQILNDIQNVGSRSKNLPIVKDLERYLELVGEDKWDSEEALALRKKLDAWSNGHEPLLLKADMDIRMRKFRRTKK